MFGKTDYKLIKLSERSFGRDALRYLCDVGGRGNGADPSSLPNPVDVSAAVGVGLPHHVLWLGEDTLLLHEVANPVRHKGVITELKQQAFKLIRPHELIHLTVFMMSESKE